MSLSLRGQSEVHEIRPDIQFTRDLLEAMFDCTDTKETERWEIPGREKRGYELLGTLPDGRFFNINYTEFMEERKT